MCIVSPDDANDGTWATFCHLALIEKRSLALDSLVVEKTAESQQFFRVLFILLADGPVCIPNNPPSTPHSLPSFGKESQL